MEWPRQQRFEECSYLIEGEGKNWCEEVFRIDEDSTKDEISEKERRRRREGKKDSFIYSLTSCSARWMDAVVLERRDIEVDEDSRSSRGVKVKR